MSSKHVTLAVEIWESIKEHLPVENQQDAANAVVAILADDYDCSSSELRDFFGNDPHIKRAIKDYMVEDTEFDHDEDE